jgi:hypothetical protein
MGHWGVKSFENDGADEAIDAAFERVHGEAYEAAMDDRNPLTFDQAQESLANSQTLIEALEILREWVSKPFEEWDDVDRLAFAGVVVRHAEFGVPIPRETLDRAIDWLETESIEWEEATVRRLRRMKELALLKKSREHR